MNQGNGKIGSQLPPDVILETLPYLTVDDIKNLSLTNKYYHKLLDYQNSDTLWKELYHKVYGSPLTNHEPFQCKEGSTFRSCSENIINSSNLGNTWLERYKLRSEKTKLFTWGSIKQGRLGYTASSNPYIRSRGNERMRGAWRVDEDLSQFNYYPLRLAVCLPTQVPWGNEIGNIPNDDDIITSVSAGGFSFQILTKSGKIFSTGTSFTGGLRGPGPSDGQSDYNQFRDLTRLLELSFTQLSNPGSTHHGPTPINTHRTITSIENNQTQTPTNTTIEEPHADIYQNLEQLGQAINENAPGNDHISRMYPRDSLPSSSATSGGPFVFNKELLNKIKFCALTSGRSHFLALSTEGNVYVWDSPESNDGIRVTFPNLPEFSVDPILKIGCGWNFNCIFQYNVGLIVWRHREALKSGETSSNAIYDVIPGTYATNGESKIIDFTCLSDCVVFYIDQSGEYLYRYFNKSVEKLQTPIKQKIIKLVSCFNSIILFTENHCYSFKLKDNKIQLDSIKELKIGEDDEIVSLSSGDYHTLILTKKGQIYALGSESQLCGCLGLGMYENESWGHLEGHNNLIVETPQIINIGEGNICIGIAAGGWQSSALIISKS
ncbi:hypothetical protein C6P45_003828 [Maudiozyma exigua]|uniref:F-box domain-containing protein n=1 Tax=Maudiozyma exigua TaxID=34358 RepID=A0A9P6WCK3_MAUEX|nr:hypothetical protein C6P45_003828 [Kazachstania exigua]